MRGVHFDAKLSQIDEGKRLFDGTLGRCEFTATHPTFAFGVVTPKYSDFL